MSSPSSTTLSDIGERRLVSDYLAPRYRLKSKWHYGDDCAVILDTRKWPEGLVVATTDPAPRPVAWELGFNDYYYWGWLTAALNWSDIAAAGAEPVGLLTSLTLPNEMLLADFLRLLDGLDDCSTAIGSEIYGGNLKEGEWIHCEGTAFGIVPRGDPLSREGARPGDVVCAVGHTGLFWAGFLALQAGLRLDEDESTLVLASILKPTPQITVGRQLRASRIISSCTDNSDGLYGSLWALSKYSRVGIDIDADSFQYRDIVVHVADELKMDPIRLALGFGDLQLICTTAASTVDDLQALCKDLSIDFSPLGRVTHGQDLCLIKKGKRGTLANFDNERFTRSSQFTAGFDSYRQRLLENPLWESSAYSANDAFGP